MRDSAQYRRNRYATDTAYADRERQRQREWKLLPAAVLILLMLRRSGGINGVTMPPTQPTRSAPANIKMIFVARFWRSRIVWVAFDARHSATRIVGITRLWSFITSILH